MEFQSENAIRDDKVEVLRLLFDSFDVGLLTVRQNNCAPNHSGSGLSIRFYSI